MSFKDILVVLLAWAGLIWYYVSIFSLGRNPRDANQPQTTFQQFMSLSVTSIGVSLATYVGMLLGLQSVSETAKFSFESVAPEVRRIIEGTLVSNLQWCAAALYVVSLFCALYFWKRGGDKTDPAVSNLGKSLLGLIAGALAIALTPPQ
jgi:Na+/H+-translocating membrane pyrophosphatase